jgi:hypothetical protein
MAKTPSSTDYLSAIRTGFQAILKLEDEDVPMVDFFSCLAVLNQWSSNLEPVWGYIIGPPGSAKTEVLRTLDGWDMSYVVDELTENALASGYTDEENKSDDPSLLPLLNKKVLVIKDFTSFSSAQAPVLLKVLSTLRAAYDGSYTKHSGAAASRTYQCKFGILAATVPTIDQFMQENQKLGERFVSLRIRRNGAGTLRARTQRLKHVMDMTANKTQWRADLRCMVHHNFSAFLKDVTILPEQITLTSYEFDKVALIGDLISRLRTTPYDGMPAAAESGGRIVQQFFNIARARAALSGRTSINTEDINFIIRIAQDTLPIIVKKLCEVIYHSTQHNGQGVSSETLSKYCTGGSSAVHEYLKQYLFLGIIEKKTIGGTAKYKLSDETLEQIQLCSFFPDYL